ncbi:methyltransferasedomain-containing protein [Cordyceps javanica]|uniref:Methyltransferasedomain-containing protein n=1 Tax=Cordyceps javanica TaxID=43265 RepID=A0A545UKP0_9HYPO|nr:methyltransferasedomain-containing protein [Cordyceps javanica]
MDGTSSSRASSTHLLFIMASNASNAKARLLLAKRRSSDLKSSKVSEHSFREWRPEDELGIDYNSDDQDQPTLRKQSDLISRTEWNGRKFSRFKDSPWCVTDELWRDSLVDYHQFILSTNSTPFKAPVSDTFKQPDKILVIGAGTGTLAIDLARKYQSAEVIGIDTVDNFDKSPPTNCSFQVHIFEPFPTFQPSSFDYIFIIDVNDRIQNLSLFYKRIFQVLKASGHVEHSETQVDVASSDAPFWQQFRQISARIRLKTAIHANDMLQELKEAGFIDAAWATDRLSATPFCSDVEGRVLPVLIDRLGGGFPPKFDLGMDRLNKIIREMCSHMKSEASRIGTKPFATRYILYGTKPDISVRAV